MHFRRTLWKKGNPSWTYLVLAATGLSSCDIHERTLELETRNDGGASGSFSAQFGGRTSTVSASPFTPGGGSPSATIDQTRAGESGGGGMGGSLGSATLGGEAGSAATTVPIFGGGTGGVVTVVESAGGTPPHSTASAGGATSASGGVTSTSGGRSGAGSDAGIATGGVSTGGMMATGGAATGGMATGGAPSCLIGSVSYLPGTPNPSNQCQHCRPEVTQEIWTPRSDGTPCEKSAEICRTGKCERGCFIGNTFYLENSFEPGNQCRSCQPSVSTTQWSNVQNRTGCGMNQICHAGECKSGCYVAGVFYDPNQTNPSNPCQSCQVGRSLDSWSTLDSANGASCGVGKVCRTGACEPACYIEAKFYGPDDNDSASPCGRCIPTKKTDGWSLRSECFKALSLGGSHSCALVDTAIVWCWGRNHLRQLGDEAGQDSTKPVKVVNSVRSTALAAGSAHTCVIRDGVVLCWGANSSGQVGNGTLSESQSLPLKVLELAQASAIAAGSFHTCALDAMGAVRCWGDNRSGQLGAASSDVNSARPMAVTGIDGTNDESTAIAIAAGGAHSCALMLNGSVLCWGKNTAGQLGDGTNQDQKSPVEVRNLTDAVAIAAGYTHSCAVLTGGDVKCWGSNASGELGDGKTSPSNVPVQVGTSYIDTATAVTAGQSFTCARLKTGAIKCWGNDSSDQLGNGAGDGNIQTTPVSVLNLSTAVWAGAGAGHACAGLSGGGLQCWGGNVYGQLGDGSKSDRGEPTNVLGF